MNKETSPEEGDFNTSSMREGLKPEEKKNLKKDLEAVESGDGSSESILKGGAALEPRDDFHRQWHLGNERAEMEEAGMESQVEDFQKFVRAKGFTDEQISYDEIYSFLKYGDTKMPFVRGANPKLEKQLEELEEEWETERKKKLTHPE